MVVIRAERFGKDYHIVAEREYVKRRVPGPLGFARVMGTETLFWTGRSWVGAKELAQAQQFPDVEAAGRVIEQGGIEVQLPAEWQQQMAASVIAHSG